MPGESVVWFLLILALFGLIVGAIGRLLVPGPTPIGALGTMGAGVAGALIGGFIGRLLFGPGLTVGWSWVLSILCAAAVVALVSRRRVVDDDYDEVVVEEEVVDPYPRRRAPYRGPFRGRGPRRRRWF